MIGHVLVVGLDVSGEVVGCGVGFVALIAGESSESFLVFVVLLKRFFVEFLVMGPGELEMLKIQF